MSGSCCNRWLAVLQLYAAGFWSATSTVLLGCVLCCFLNFVALNTPCRAVCCAVFLFFLQARDWLEELWMLDLPPAVDSGSEEDY
jgi:hypothetical protein